MLPEQRMHSRQLPLAEGHLSFLSLISNDSLLSKGPTLLLHLFP